MQKISKLLRQKSFGVRSQVLDVFLDLNLSEINVLDDKQKNKKMKHKDKMRRLSRTERKVTNKFYLFIYLNLNFWSQLRLIYARN